MADISNILPNVADSVTHPQVKGLQLPAGVNFTIVEPSACVGCPKSLNQGGQHPCMVGLSIQGRSNYEAMINLQNTYIDRIRKIQIIKELMRFAAHSVDMGTELNLINNGIVLNYPIVSAGSSVTATYIPGTPNPKSIPYQVFSPNPDWPAPNTPALIVQTFNVRLRAGGRMRFVGGSLLSYHNGIRVNRVSFSETIDYGGAITFDLDSPASLATQQFHGSSGFTYTAYEYYTGVYQEPDIAPRPANAIFGEKVERTFQLPSPEIQIIEYGLVSQFSSLVALKTVNGVTTDESLTAKTAVVVTFENGNYISTISLGLFGHQTGTLRLTYYKQSNNPDAEYIGCKTCVNFKVDHSDSYPNYCAKASTANQVARFHNDCYLSNCNQYQRALPTNPFSRRIMAQLYHEEPWVMVQKQPGIADDIEVLRLGAASFRSLIGELLETPGGWHPFKIFRSSGGWQNTEVVDDRLEVKNAGFEWEYGDTNEFAFGPAGDNFARSSGMFGTSASSAERGALLTTTPAIHAYRASLVGSYGTFQRCNQNFDLVIPGINFVNNQFTFPGGIIYLGMWGPDFRPVTSNPTYFAKIQLSKVNPYERIGNQTWSQTKHTTRPVYYEYDGLTKEYELHLKNLINSASSTSSFQEERETFWQSSMTNVDAPSQFRFNNYKSDHSYRGPRGWLIKTGDVCFIPGTNRKFFVTYARAASGVNQSWFPGSKRESRTVQYPSYTMTIPSGQTVTNVAVTGGVTWAPITGPFPPVHLEKNQFWWDYNETTGVVSFKFSNYNLTTNPTDFYVDIRVNTNLTFYTTSGLDLLSLLINRCNYTWVSSQNFTSINSVRYKYTDTTGNLTYRDLTAVPIKPKLSDYGDYEYSVKVNGPKNYQFTFSANLLLSGSLEIIADFGSSSGYASDSQFFNAEVATLHGSSFPPGKWDGQPYQVYGRKSDVIRVKDEEDAIKRWLQEGGIFSVEDLQFSTSAIAHYRRPTLYTSKYQSSEPDQTILNFGYFGANGEIFLRFIPLTNTCIFIKDIMLADTSLAPRTGEINAPRAMIERGLS